jgi:phospholipid/cholesterol/gamma-HCH transport system ATP-binding protein
MVEATHDPAQEAAHVRELILGVVESCRDDRDLGQRLSSSSPVTLHFTDAEAESLTLLLDRSPIEAVPYGAADNGVEICGPASSWRAFWSGRADLPIAIMDGEMTCKGPVRDFLRVAPIMRSVISERLGEGAAQTEELEWREEARATGRVDPAPATEPAPAPSRGVDQRTVNLLDQAADYQYHSDPVDWKEEHPGDFWSIRCTDVYKRFGSNQVLNGLNLGVPEGTITVVLGPSGTGKSVLINHLIGLLFPDSGDIRVHGLSVPRLHLSELLALRRKFGVLFQDGALFGSMSVYDNVAFPLRQHTNKSEDEIASMVMGRLADVGLESAGDRMPNELSGGMRKRAGFARALVMEPQIVIFDEPDSGLDPVRTALLCQLIQRIHKEHGGTYIVITHDIASARRIGEYLAVLWKGRIVESGNAERMFASENPFVRQFLNGDPLGPLGME